MADSKKQLRVQDPDAHYEAHRSDWRLVRTLYIGTKAMREAKTEFLPQEEGETGREYESRLARSFCYSGVENAVDDIVGRMFGAPMSIDSMSPAWEPIFADADLCGNGFHRFWRDAAIQATINGIAYVLVDQPRVAASNLAEQRAANVRPFLRLLRAEEVIGLRAGRRNGVEIVEQLRISECEMVPDGEFGERAVHQIRVLDAPAGEQTSCYYRIFRKVGDTDEYALVEEGAFDAQEIPLVAVYTERNGFMRATVPLRNLAWTNVAHWQSSSDQRNILRIGRVPILFASGVRKEEIAPDGKIEIGSSRIYAFADNTASMRYVEHSGAAIEAGARDLEQLEKQMKEQSVELIERPGDRTATEAAIKSAQDNSWLADVKQGIEDAIALALEYCAMWMNLSPDTIPTVALVMRDEGKVNATEVDTLNRARDRGDITRVTYLSELNRRNLFAEGFDPEEEAQKANDEEDREPDMSGTGRRVPPTPPAMDTDEELPNE
jgi:hypothetical protein